MRNRRALAIILVAPFVGFQTCMFVYFAMQMATMLTIFVVGATSLGFALAGAVLLAGKGDE